MLPTVMPGQNAGALRFVSLVLHIPPQATGTADSAGPEALTIGRKAPQERFSEESLQSYNRLETHFSKAQP
jgi:hypothetical protein